MIIVKIDQNHAR